MTKQEKKKERELIEAIRELTNELKHERLYSKQKTMESINVFIDFLKTEKGRDFLETFFGFMACAHSTGLFISQAGVRSDKVFEKYLNQLKNL